MSLYVDNKQYTDAVMAKFGCQTSNAIGMVKADLEAIVQGDTPQYLSQTDYAPDFITAFNKLSASEKDAAFLDAELLYNGPAEVIHKPGSVIEDHGVNLETGEFK